MEKILITEVCDILVGRTPSRYNPVYWGAGFPWLSIADMNQGESIYSTKETITTDAVTECKCKMVPKGTVLFSFKLSIGKVGITAIDMFTNEAIAAFLIKDKSRLDTKFLFYTLKSTDYSVGSNKAVMGKTLNKEQLKKFTIPLPSIEEQYRIVKILDLAQSLIEKRKQAISYLDDYIKAVFLDMFGDPVSNPKGWEVGKIGDLVSEVNYGTSAKAGSIGKFPYLRMNNITYNGEFNLSDLKYIDLAESDIDKYTVSNGDLLFNRTNSKELVGKTAVVNFENSMAFAGYLIRLKTNKKAIPEYISGYLNSKHGKTTLMHMCKSIVGMANINAKELQKMRILIPSVETQALYKKIYHDMQSLKQKMQSQLRELEDNFQVQLQRAFRGE